MSAHILPLVLSVALCVGVGSQTAVSLSQTPSPTLPDVVDAPIRYELPVPESESVGREWFEDAVILGDSRTEGLLLYSDLKVGLGLSKVGLNVSTALNKASYTVNGKTLTLAQALEGGEWTKVYIMLGVNECAWMNKDKFYTNYCGIVDVVREKLPDAQIYIQTLPPVSAARSAGSGPNNSYVRTFNELITKLCIEKEVYRVDVAEVFTDESGNLPGKYSSDGLHFNKNALNLWIEYLETHTVQE